MKRKAGVCFSTLLLVVVLVTSVLIGPLSGVALAASADPDALQIASIKLSKNATDLIVRMEFTNDGDADITEFGISLAFYDGADERIFAQPLTMQGYIDDISSWYYTPDTAIGTGTAYKTEDSFTGYLKTTRLDVAIRYYQKASGESVFIPESEWNWYSSNGDVVKVSQKRAFYDEPEQAVFDQTKNVTLGYHYYLLDNYNAPSYAFSEGGEWIDEIDIGSLADTGGLMVGDLVISADGVKPTENLYAVEYAMVKIADGEKTDWEIVRNGEAMTVTLALSR